MNKNYKPINYSFREYYHIHGRFSPEMVEELLDLVDDLAANISSLESTVRGLEDEARYW